MPARTSAAVAALGRLARWFVASRRFGLPAQRWRLASIAVLLAALVGASAQTPAERSPLGLTLDLWQERLAEPELGKPLLSTMSAELEQLQATSQTALEAAHEPLRRALGELPNQATPAQTKAQLEVIASLRERLTQATADAQQAARLVDEVAERTALADITKELQAIEAGLATNTDNEQDLSGWHARASALATRISGRLDELDRAKRDLADQLRALLPGLPKAAAPAPETQADTTDPKKRSNGDEEPQSSAGSSPGQGLATSVPPLLVGQPEALVEKAQQLLGEYQQRSAWQGDYRLAQLRNSQALNSLNRAIGQQAAASLLVAGPSFAGLLKAAFGQTSDWGRSLGAMVSAGVLPVLARWPWIALGLVALVLVAWWLGRLLAAWLRRRSRPEPGPGFLARLAQSVQTSTARHVVYLLPLAALVVAFTWLAPGEGETPFLALAAQAALLFLALRLANRALLAPYAPAGDLTGLPRPLELVIARRLTMLALAGALGYYLWSLQNQFDLPAVMLLLLRAAVVVLLVVNLAWLLVIVSRVPAIARWGLGTRLLGAVLLVLGLGMEALGYRNLATYLLRGVIGTLLLLPMAWIIRRLLDDLFNHLRFGSAPWARSLRSWLKLAVGEAVPGVSWLRFSVGLAYWLGLGTGLVRIWSTSGGYATARAAVSATYMVGNYELVPNLVAGALMLLGLLQAVAAWLALALRGAMASNRRLDAGAREAFGTLFGYIGFALALLIALSMLRVSFTGLAVVAGALSVGIGFGLQNIVSNFVSGLILLVERPLKVGDWIEVGSMVGFVTRISVRATEITTFDASDVVIPNSDLISKPLVNRTRHNRYGRITVAVGVAYGSDLTQASELLLELARGHEEVVTEMGFAPFIVIVGLGDNSVNLELRCVVKDVSKRESVRTLIYQEVHDRFREVGLSIPFPQRDVHLIADDSAAT